MIIVQANSVISFRLLWELEYSPYTRQFTISELGIAGWSMKDVKEAFDGGQLKHFEFRLSILWQHYS